MADDFRLKNVLIVATIIGAAVLVVGLLGVWNTF